MTTHFETLVNRELIAVDIEPADRGDLTLETFGGQICAPPPSVKLLKPRQKKQPAQPAAPQPLQSPMPTAMGMPLAMPLPMWHLPFAAVSPLPMQQLGYTPPRA